MNLLDLASNYIGHMPAWMLEISEETKKKAAKNCDFIYYFCISPYKPPQDMLTLQTVYDQEFWIPLGPINLEDNRDSYCTLDQAINELLDDLEDWIEAGVYTDTN